MLTKAVRKHLRSMKAAYDAQDWDNAEIVCEGNSCWLGLTRVSMATVNRMLCDLLVKEQRSQGVSRYTISSTAIHVLKRPELVLEIRAAIEKGKSFTITEDAILVEI